MDYDAPTIKASIYEIEASRNRALMAYQDAYDMLEQARSYHISAGSGDSPVIGFGRYSSNVSFAGREDRGKFLDRVRQEVDRGIWLHVISALKLESLMDRKARDDFRKELQENPPEATAENCLAMTQQFIGESGMIFRRGIANAFSGLDRRFRSHDGFKIGSRIVLTYAFSDYGSMTPRTQEIIRDVERAFHVMDGKTTAPDWNDGICAKVAKETIGFRRNAFVVEDDYFTLKAFKNGNAHLWFKRDDLLEKVNKLLAEHYGAVLGAGADAVDPHEGKRSNAVAKNMGFFETPYEVVRRVLESAGVPVYQGNRKKLTILEPSAGRGALASVAASAGHRVTCVEAHGGRFTELAASGLYAKVMNEDFLELRPDEVGWFDRVIMNPPFDKGLDIDHVRHAFKFLKPGGILCAVMSAGTEFREDNRSVSFREWAQRLRKDTYSDQMFTDLPAGSFKESGTMVNTCLVTLRAPLG